MIDNPSSAQDKVDFIGGAIVQPVSQISMAPFPLYVSSLSTQEDLTALKGRLMTFNELLLQKHTVEFSKGPKSRNLKNRILSRTWDGSCVVLTQTSNQSNQSGVIPILSNIKWKLQK